jgi:hypothetical protein
MLLESESKAVALFERMGRENIAQRLDELSSAADERYQSADHIPNGWTVIDFMRPDEREERYLLVLALTLCTAPQEEARRRIIERRKR